MSNLDKFAYMHACMYFHPGKRRNKEERSCHGNSNSGMVRNLRRSGRTRKGVFGFYVCLLKVRKREEKSVQRTGNRRQVGSKLLQTEEQDRGEQRSIYVRSWGLNAR